MAGLFDPIDINGMTLRNRSVRSATWAGMAEPDGRCSERLTQLLVALANGEVGLIIPGFAFVMPNGRAMVRQLGIHDDAMIPGLATMTGRVHEAGGKICLQIAHAGAQTAMKESDVQPVWGPSAIHEKVFNKTPRAMTQKEIRRTVQAFGEAAARAKKAGFDAVQLHGAHGYLISQFLSPCRNKRTDRYGGPVENRARFLFETYRAVRKAVGKDFPVLIKMNSKDFVRGGLTEKDSLFVATELDKMGIDAIELSGGIPAAGPLSSARQKILKAGDEAYFLPAARKIKKQISVPLILVGGVRSYKKASDIIESGDADMISMARPFIREPWLIKRWRQGNRGKATCISCNQCFGAGLSHEGIYCVVERKLQEKKKTK